jgi:uncharacterized protein (DUF1015 family)
VTPGSNASPSLFRPFGAYLPRPDLAEQVVAPQYDNLTIDETHQIVAGNPLSFLNVVRSEIDHPEHSSEDRRAMLIETAERLRRLLDGEIFDYYEPPVFFVCRLELDGHTQVGIVADLALEAYDRGLVKVHESTRRGQEDRLVEYMDTVQASFLPIFLIHRKVTRIDDVVSRVVARAPLIDIQADSKLRIAFWVVDSGDEVAAIEAVVAELDTVYIADGHHRAAAASRYASRRRGAAAPGLEPYEHLMSVLFSADQLVVHSYNRCLTDLGGLSSEELMAEIAETFAVVEVSEDDDPTPASTGEFSMYLDGRWHRITVPEHLREVAGVAGLDVSVLHEHLLEPVLGVVDARTDPRIEFVPGTLGIGELEHLCETEFAVAFAVAPMDVADMLTVADRGEIMPPKSTWFAPKLRSGLVVRLLGES